MESRAFPASSTTHRRVRTGRRVSRWRATATPTPTGRWSRSNTRRGHAARVPAGRVHLRGLRDVRPAQRRAFRGRAARPVDVALVPAVDWLALSEREASESVPYLLAVDADDVLHRVIVDARMMQATRRCLLLWHRLQEHAGSTIPTPSACSSREGAWEAQKNEEIEALRKSWPQHPPPPPGKLPPPCRAPRHPRSRSRSRGRGEAAVRRPVDRDGALPQLQRVPAHQPADVRLQRQQAGLHQGSDAERSGTWSRRRRPARSRSSTRASRAIRTSRARRAHQAGRAVQRVSVSRRAAGALRSASAR